MGRWVFQVQGAYTDLAEGNPAEIAPLLRVKNPKPFVPRKLRFCWNPRNTYTDFLDQTHEVPRFPTGFLSRVKSAVEKSGGHVVVQGLPQLAPEVPTDYLHGIDLHPYQRDAINTLLVEGYGVCKVATGGGKCLGPDVRVLLHSGRTTRAADVKVGDQLMGPDSRPREVLAITSGVGPMFRIEPIKGSSWTANDAHILVLVNTTTGAIVEISIERYLQKSAHWKHLHKLFTCGVTFAPHGPLSLPPYLVGLWLGDGTKPDRRGHMDCVEISKPDPEIHQYLKEVAPQFGLRVHTVAVGEGKCPSYRLTNRSQEKARAEGNWLLWQFRKIGMKWPALPSEYLSGTRTERLELLAGIIDTDGHHTKSNGFEITTQFSATARDIDLLARSLGFMSVISRSPGRVYRITLAGELDQIPTKIPRKQAQARRINKDPCRFGFTVVPLGRAPYHGFTLTGDGRFLLADCTVTHNTEIMAGVLGWLRRNEGVRSLIILNGKSPMHQTAERLKERLGGDVSIGMIGDGYHQYDRDITVGIVASLRRGLNGNKALAKFLRHVGATAIDECHHTSASTWYDVTMACKHARYRYGFSGTPRTKIGLRNFRLEGACGPVVVDVARRELIDEGFLVDAAIFVLTDRDAFGPRLHSGWEWDKVYRHGIVRNEEYNEVVAKLARALSEAGRKTLVLSAQTRQHQLICRHLREWEVPHAVIDGDTPSGVRADMLGRFKNGSNNIIIASSLPRSERIVVRNRDTGLIETVAIGKFCEQFTRTPPNENEDCLIPPVWETVGVGVSGPAWHIVQSVHRHHYDGIVGKATLKNSKIFDVCITDNHSLVYRGKDGMHESKPLPGAAVSFLTAWPSDTSFGKIRTLDVCSLFCSRLPADERRKFYAWIVGPTQAKIRSYKTWRVILRAAARSDLSALRISSDRMARNTERLCKDGMLTEHGQVTTAGTRFLSFLDAFLGAYKHNRKRFLVPLETVAKSPEFHEFSEVRITAFRTKSYIKGLIPVTKEVAALLGMFVADGCVCTNKSVTLVVISACHDNPGVRIVRGREVVAARLKRKLAKRAFAQMTGNAKVRQTEKQIVVTSTVLGRFMQDVLGAGQYSENKTVPWVVYNFTDARVRNFLTGFYLCDGCASVSGVQFISTSRALIQGLNLLLRRLGIKRIGGNLNIPSHPGYFPRYTLYAAETMHIGPPHIRDRYPTSHFIPKETRHPGVATSRVRSFTGEPTPNDPVYDIGVSGCRNFVSGTGLIVCHNTVFDESQDIPQMTDLVLAGGQKAENLIVQRTGRALRCSEGKGTARIWDFAHASHKFLLRHALDRLKVYRKEGHKVREVKTVAELLKLAKEDVCSSTHVIQKRGRTRSLFA